MPHPSRRLESFALCFQLLAILVGWSLPFSNVVAEITHDPSLSQAWVISDSASHIVQKTSTAAPSDAAPAPQRAIDPDKDKALDCNNNTTNGRYELADAVNVRTSQPNEAAARWGEITIAQPKIWQFERVSAMLDGLLRDLEGVSLTDLTQLDANKQNAAALTFIQQALEVGVQYDQAAAVNNRNIQRNFSETYNTQLQQLNLYSAYTQTLASERDRLARELTASTNEVNTLQSLGADNSLTSEQAAQLAAALIRQKNAQASLTQMNSLISGAGPAPTLPTPPNLAGTSVTGPASGSPTSSTLMGFADVLKSLPPGVTDNLSAALKSPTYPATKQLDNFITLLYERLAREVSAMQDDLMRDPENTAFLLQFDVGLYPADRSRDRVARVEFNLDCPGCKVYSLYPGQSAYNIANYSGSSKRTTLWGNVSTLIGFGLSASYRRQRDTLQGSLVQSVYTSGFQNGVRDEYSEDEPEPNRDDHSKKLHAIPDSSQAEQSFGWYYGSAPFEKLVSPGIRSTFALVTVPRALIDGAHDPFGNTNACLAFHINGAWANRNDPLAQHYYESYLKDAGKVPRYPFYRPERRLLQEKDDRGAKDHNGGYKRYGTDHYLESVVKKMTSVRLPAPPDDTPLVARRRKQNLHILKMEYNTVYEDPQPEDPTKAPTVASAPPANARTPSSATTAAPGSPISSTAQQSLLDPLRCLPKQCAAVHLTLDRPIDPNLAITVHGKPLSRVRDWRGRATSILPAAQSQSDIPTPPGSTPQARNGLASAALLEADQLGPNTWLALNSHELVLNISKDVATDEDFPIIQVADPGDSVVIPHDLRRNVTELVVNNFRLKALTEKGVQTEALVNRWNGTGKPPDGPTTDGPITIGPYPFSTFLPLFLPEPDPQTFFVATGETGYDLLVGMLPNRPHGVNKAKRHNWMESRIQVILEDPDLDFAWSLSCRVQGELLACSLPRAEISQAYFNYLLACPNDTACLTSNVGPSNLSLEMAIPQGLREGFRNGTIPAAAFKPRNVRDMSGGSDQAVPSMELWVEQSDPEGNDQFYSPAPAKINYLPVSKDFWKDNPKFKSWEFDSADADKTTIRGCKYYPGSPIRNLDLLGFAGEQLPVQGDVGNECATASLDTLALTHDPIVFDMRTADQEKKHVTTVALPSSLLKPAFGRPQVDPKIEEPGNRAVTTKWEVILPVTRTTPADDVELPASSPTAVTWQSGSRQLKSCQPPTGGPCNVDTVAWKKANKAANLQVKLGLTRAGLMNLPTDLHITRTNSQGAKVNVGDLPDLRELLLPSKLSLENLSSTQFMLRGKNASVIDAIALQNGSDAHTYAAATGVDFALVTLPDQSSGDKSNTGNNGAETTTSTRIVAGANTATVELQASSKPTAPKPASPTAKTPATGPSTAPEQKQPAGSTPAPPKPGTYAVIPLMTVSCTIDTTDPKTKKKSTRTPTDIKECFGVPGENQKISPNYAPLDVQDSKKKPLYFTIPDPNKKAATTPATPTPSCAMPCVVAGCVAACPPATSTPATPKTQ